MTEILFESPFWLGIVLAPVLFVLWGLWFRTRTPRAVRALLVGLVIAPLLLVCQWLVVTDREKLQLTATRLSNAVGRHDIDAIIELIEPDAQFDGRFSRQDFRDHLVMLLEKYSVENPTIGGFVIEIAGDRATVRCSSMCHVELSGWAGNVPSSWELKFQLFEDGWLITDLRPLKIAGRDYRSFFEIP